MLQSKKIILKLEGGFVRFQNAIMIITTTMLFSAVFIGVIMRYFMHMSMSGLEELIAMCAMWSYFIGTGSVSMSDDHISADILSFIIKNQRILRRLKTVSWVLRAILSIIFFGFAISFINDSIELVTRTPQFKIPYYYSYFSVVYGAFIMCVYTIKHAINFMSQKHDSSSTLNSVFLNGGKNSND